MIATNVNQIKANVKTGWSHHKHKFQPGELATVNESILPHRHGGYESQIKQRRVGRSGVVVAVSCLPNGNTRSSKYDTDRMYTKYYLKFQDGPIMGFHSHHLDRDEYC